MPVIEPPAAVRRPIATATASSSSSSIGGRSAPALRPVAGGACGGKHGVAEAAQSVDIAAHGARSDLQSLGQFGAGPVTSGLQERQSRQPCRGFPHV